MFLLKLRQRLCADNINDDAISIPLRSLSEDWVLCDLARFFSSNNLVSSSTEVKRKVADAEACHLISQLVAPVSNGVCSLFLLAHVSSFSVGKSLSGRGTRKWPTRSELPGDGRHASAISSIVQDKAAIQRTPASRPKLKKSGNGRPG